ncbi:MAG: recombination protein RecR, partial [Patescibacteria group bacterium]
MLSPSIEKLIKIFAKFPTIGPKTAARFVFYLLDSPALTSDELIESIKELKVKIKTCPWCFKIFE